MSDDVDMNLKNMEKFIKTLKGKIPKARVGVLGDKNARNDSESNASIGAKHEFGEEGLPVRSFLRMPISLHLQKYMEKSGAFSEDALKNIVKEGSFEKFVKKMGAVGESIVQDAFSTGGFGKWKPSRMENKQTKQTLVETQQLRNSITSDVKG